MVTRKDLTYRYDSNPQSEGAYIKDSSTSFDRNNADHVLLIINQFFNHYQIEKYCAEIMKAERFIRVELPKKQYSFDEVFLWLKRVW